jgi:hypothetical protein
MSDFLKAILTGVESARSVDTAQREISEVLGELNKSVQAATQGKAELWVEESPLRNALSMLSNTASSTISTIFVGPSGAINKRVPIGTIAVSPTGYPVVVSANGAVSSSNDAAGLRKGLAMLLARPESGRAILDILSPQPAASASKLAGPPPSPNALRTSSSIRTSTRTRKPS